jgi:acetyl esterase/lipase/lysophospholipase L1-like esterase
MNRYLILLALLLLAGITSKAQQKVIPLYSGAAPGSESWTYNEQQITGTNIPLVYNVSHPTLTAYLPDPAIATGTGVIICPGGGFYILSVKDEGTDLAKWLNERGVAAFILKYRTGQSLTNDPAQELGAKMRQGDFKTLIKPLVEMAITDGREAIKYVRRHAADFNISPSRIGIIGFSAGGTVAGASAFNYTADTRPNFAAPIYGYLPTEILGNVPADAPPVFVAAADNDDLGLAPNSVAYYSLFQAAKKPAELHIYQKGGHGFGMHKQGIPTDTWVDRFGDWMKLNGWLTPLDPKATAELAQRERNKMDWPGEKRVVFMGNSITWAWKWLDSSFFYNRHYYCRGISGQTTGQMLVRFREDVINLKPKAVVILAGINDIAQNNGPARVEDIFGNIKSMAELARANRIKVVISSVLPAYTIPWRTAIDPKPGVAALNKLLKAYCQESHLVYLDYFSVMADSRAGLPASLSKDGVHPTLDGYKIMEPLAEKAIAEAMRNEK